ncbi:MAG: hypothetical protein IPJ65_31525 [Archangiaceae bacterium]|nr:hypothetical protein [Archangiaceae bacterium]
MVCLLALLAVVRAAPDASTEVAPGKEHTSFSSPLGFAILLPPGFVERPEGEKAPIKHLWVRNPGGADFAQIAVQAYSGTIGQACMAADELPAGTRPFTSRWDGIVVCGMRTEQTVKEQTLLDLSVELPTSPAAVVLHVAGWPKNEPALKALLMSLLTTLVGPNTWRVEFGCFDVELPEGWGLIRGSTTSKLELAPRKPLATDARELRPQFNIGTLKAAEPVPLRVAEENAVREARASARGEVKTRKATLAGKPAVELRYSSVDEKGVTLKNRILVVPAEQVVHLLSLGTEEAFVKQVDPIADAMLATARYTCK